MLVAALCLLLGGSIVASAQIDNGYQLSWWTVDGGGKTGISGGAYTLLSTAGQPDARGAIVGGDYTLFSGFWPGQPRQISRLNLPLVFKGRTSTSADLVGSFSLMPDESNYTAGEAVQITAIVTNVGSGRADPFWVDLYINPASTPGVNVPWNNTCTLSPCYGIAWYVAGGLGSGESVNLTSTPTSYSLLHTIWPGYFAAGTQDLYLLVDSWNPGVSTGGVPESNEANNLSELHGLTVSGESSDAAALPALEKIPARPAP